MPRLLSLLLTTLIFASPQAPNDTSVYTVAYVEVMPAASKEAALTVKQYRDTSKKEDGFVGLDLFEQVGRPGHLAIVETWANAKALEGHQAAAHTKEFRMKLDPIRLSDYDQRPYKTLAFGSPASANARATYVIAHVDIGGQGTNVADLLRRLAEASRKEQGNLRFDVLQHAMRANHFTVIEAWQNDRALEAHAAAAHTKQYRDGIAPISGSPLDERLYKLIQE
jgi:autoinducer 2-degrading protein